MGQRVVLIAGVTGALGRAVAEELSEHGYELKGIGRNESAMAELKQRLPALELVAADLTDLAEAGEAVSRLAPFDAVVDVVGGFALGPPLHETDPTAFRELLDLNLTTAYNLARAALPVLLERQGGPFVVTSARAALEPFAGASAYVISKAALLALMRMIDVEYRKRGIRANAILPGVIDTEANRRANPGADRSSWVDPRAIARVVRFLVSDDSAPIAGQLVPVWAAP
ncbi:SDR family NAD(P)-dependent oxidoreductase [Thermoleophilum album]|uniref:NADP-dependent 3-hydroxy acid dehydrogenase YdfG n=1 Tax=Thermoleophilum album TaxID=29539 RepID=A0A1H6FP35_THEAL|nr:SDR family NAD(P)-dependent oxidoreductase [Thermoleophilum album]SEH11524.1 NADP-dependent 3-hydroxy acid dehydrogenase YdfG [Thermoleophilum album]